MTEPVVLNDGQGHERIRIGEITELGGGGAVGVKVADYWGMRVKNAAGVDVIEVGRSGPPPAIASQPQVVPPETTVAVGGGGFDGHLAIRHSAGEPILEAKIGQPGPHPTGSLVPAARPCNLRIGSMLYPGSVTATAVSPPATRAVLQGGPPALELIHADQPRVRIDGDNADLRLGGNGTHGDLLLFDDSGDNATIDKATIHVRAKNPMLAMNVAGKPRARLDGVNGTLWLGGNNEDGDIVLFDKSGDNATTSKATIHLRADVGDILLQNADCAEEFEVADATTVDPGTVVVIEAVGRLRPSTDAYDRRVAGVISGAGDCRPAITLGRAETAASRMPVALVGRVFCKADASEAAIEVGDLLTTSARAGHAMKATDPERAFGSVLGKALAPLRTATALIPILVSLQ